MTLIVRQASGGRKSQKLRLIIQVILGIKVNLFVVEP